MGSQAIQFLGHFPVSLCHSCNIVFANDYCIYSNRFNWERNAKPKQKSRFSDAYAPQEYDQEVDFGFRNASKNRIWWYDDTYEEDDDEEDNGFGVREAAIGFSWVFKVFEAFGWMIPAVIVYLLLGRGPDAIAMALAVPLTQSVFSLVADTLWGAPNEKSQKKKSKTKKRPSAEAPRRARVRKENEIRAERVKGVWNYRSWADENTVHTKKGKTDPKEFGGWDELDRSI